MSIKYILWGIFLILTVLTINLLCYLEKSQWPQLMWIWYFINNIPIIIESIKEEREKLKKEVK